MPMLPNANWFDWHAAAPASNPALPPNGVPYATTPATIASATSTPPMDTTHKSIPSLKTINLYFYFEAFEANFVVLMFVVFHQCFTGILPVFHQCFATVLPVFSQCFTNVSTVFQQYYTGVSPVFHQCFTSVSTEFHP